MEKVYFIGLLKDGKKLIIQTANTVDGLSCETWKYFGQRITTKGELKNKRFDIMRVVNTQYSTNFERVQVL